MQYLEKSGERRARRERRLRHVAQVPPRRHPSRRRASIPGPPARRRRLLQLQSRATRGIQTNVFFAGVIVAGERHEPERREHAHEHRRRFLRHRGADHEHDLPRRRSSRRTRRCARSARSLTLRAGHPFLQFGKIDLSLGLSHVTYQRARRHGAELRDPDEHVRGLAVGRRAVRALGLQRRPASTSTTSARRGSRGAISPEYNDDQKSFSDFGASLGKSFYLPKFQRIGVERELPRRHSTSTASRSTSSASSARSACTASGPAPSAPRR